MKIYNAYLIKSATLLAIDADSRPDGIEAGDVIFGDIQADAYYVDNSHPLRSVGDKVFTSFGFNDSLLTKSPIYDAADDGYIVLEANGALAIERTQENFAGPAAFNLINENGSAIEALRTLGTKAGTELNGAYVYADAATRIDLINLVGDSLESNSFNRVSEGNVANDKLFGSAAHDYFLYDTALGLDLGQDVLLDLSSGDTIVTTTALWDGNRDGVIEFGSNRMLDLPGAFGGARSDESRHPGGQVVFEEGITALIYAGSQTVGAHTYYYYDATSAGQ
jgi:hypothetical protein